MPLLRAEEKALVDAVRAGAAPPDMTARMAYEMIRSSAEIIVPRTVAIDAAIAEHAAGQVVILGAGLDGRAWRMPELAAAYVCEVDQPASQGEKKDRAAALPAQRAPHYVPVDFGRDPLGQALAAGGHDAARPTTWVWEGVVPYLTPAQVTATVAEIAAASAPGSRLIVNYQTPSLGAAIGRLAVRAATRVSRRRSLWADEPRRSSWMPAAMRTLLGTYGFSLEADDDLLTVAGQLGLPVRQRLSLGNGRVAVADH